MLAFFLVLSSSKRKRLQLYFQPGGIGENVVEETTKGSDGWTWWWGNCKILKKKKKEKRGKGEKRKRSHGILPVLPNKSAKRNKNMLYYGVIPVYSHGSTSFLAYNPIYQLSKLLFAIICLGHKFSFHTATHLLFSCSIKIYPSL